MKWIPLLLLVACGAGRPDQASREARDARYAAAERAYGRGDLDDARRLFEQVAATDVDPDARALAQYRLAKIAALRGDAAAARAGYATVSAGPSQERGPLAAYQLALDALDGGDDAPMKALVDAHPDTVAADKAVRILADRVTDAAALVEWLQGVADRYRDTGVADNAVWWIADLRLERLGDIQGARRALSRLARTWPASPLVDDGLWLLARLYQRQGQWIEAAATYKALTDLRTETSYLVGSYRSRHFDDALLARGHVLYHGLKDCAGAARAYRQLLDDFETTVLRDDALFALVHAQRCAKQDPQASITQLRTKHPDSRFIERIDAPWPPDPRRLDPGAFNE